MIRGVKTRFAGISLASIVLVALCILQAKAEKYYVATTGNNEYPGIELQPFQTLAKGLSVMGAGDTLLIRGGTYNEAINSNAQTIPTGTSWADAPVISAYPNEAVTLQGESFNLPHAYIQYVSFENLTLDGLNSADNIISLGSSGANHIRFKNCEVKNAGHIGVFFHGNFNIFTGGKVHHIGNATLYPRTTSRHYGFYVEGSDNLIENAEIYSTNDFGIHGYSGYPAGSNRNIYRNLTLHETSLLYDAGSAIVLGKGDSSVAYNNVIYNSTGHGILASAQPTHARIFNNTIYGGAQTGIYVHPDAVNTQVFNNIAYGNATVQVLNEGTGTTLSNNLTTDPGFVNAGALDFHLQPGSAARDAGILLTTVTADKDGIARPQGSAYDIGAYEVETAPAIDRRHASVAPVNSGAPIIRSEGFGKVRIAWSGQPKANVIVYSPNGEKEASFKNIGNNGIVWNSGPSAGVYLVSVEAGGVRQIVKLFSKGN